MPQPQLVAVDTNVFIFLADGDEDILDAWQTIRNRVPQSQFIATPTVLAELSHIAEADPDSRTQALALSALQGMRSEWKCHPTAFNAVQELVAANAAEEIRHSGLIPVEERNDAFVLAEAAVLRCTLLLTEDSHLRSIDFERLALLLRRLELLAPVIAAGKEVIRKFYSR